MRSLYCRRTFAMTTSFPDTPVPSESPRFSREPGGAAESPVPGMDPVAVARWARMASRGEGAWLHDEVGRRMAQRLQWLRQPPASWLDWEPGQGGWEAHRAVRSQLENSKVFWLSALSGNDVYALQKRVSGDVGLWSRLRGRGGAKATPDTRVEMVWANMGLHATHQPQALLRRWHRHLNIDGFLMFSCLGPDSLRELAGLYRELGWAPSCHAFTDMHDWGDMLVQEGFAAPVMDVESITLSYASLDRLVQDLRSLGRNLHVQRCATTRGRRWLAEWRQTLEDRLPRTADGQMQLTFEVVYGHAFKPAPRVKVAATSALSLTDMRDMLSAAKSSPRD